ncbi:MAG: BatA domain-containing protein [bacterium]|nr:MAG: BatA domain-containing protein [bacterium]
MNFLNPTFLIALVAVSVPLLIHLLSRRRLPEVPFSTLRFLRRSDRRSMRRITMRRLLLLILRMAGIALLVLACARPVVRGGLAALFPAGGSRTACLLLDRSYSMGVEEDLGTLFDRARGRLAHVLENLDEENEISVVVFDSASEIVYTGERFEPDMILGPVREMELSWSGTDLRGAVAEGLRLCGSSRREERELYIISDFQRTGIGGRPRDASHVRDATPAEEGVPDSAVAATETPAVRAFLLPVHPESESNVAIEKVLTPRVTLHRGEVAEVQVIVRNSSRDLGARVPLQVLIDGRRIMEKEIELPPGGAHRERIRFPAERIGWVRGEVRKKTDHLPADDQRFFVLHVQEKMNVLLVADGEGFYLDQALSPEGSEGDLALTRRNWRNYTTADLERAEAVVLGPGRGPLVKDVELFERFITSGGTALVLVLPELERAVRALSRYEPVLEFRHLGEGFVTVARPEMQPAILAPFEREDITGITRLRFRSLPVVQGIPERLVFLAFSTGTPFVWGERRGAGMVVFLCADPRPDSSELVLSPYFLPLIQQMLLATGPEPSTGEGGIIGETIAWSGTFVGEPICRYPDGSEFKPGSEGGHGYQRGASGVRGRGGEYRAGGDPDGDVIELPPSREPGFITIFDGDETAGRIAINPDCTGESDLSFMSAREAADSLGLVHYMSIDEEQELASVLYRAREGREISIPLVLAAMAVFLFELLLAQRQRVGQEG